MPTILKQSTEIKVRIGPFVDVGDGFTPEAAVTLTGGGDNADEAEALKADGAATADISAATWAAVSGSDGWYDLTLTTSHTDTVGELVIVIQNDSVHLPVHKTFQVIEEGIYASLFAAAAAGFDASQRVNVGSWLGTAVTTSSTSAKPEVDAFSVSDDTAAADNLESACDNYSVTRGLTGTALPAVAAESAGGIYTRGTGAGQVNQDANGRIDNNTVAYAGTATSAGVGGDGLPSSISQVDRNAYLIESLQSGHAYQGNHFYLDAVNGDTHANGNRGGRTDPYLTLQDCHDNAVTDSNHDIIFLVAGHASTVTTHTIAGTTTLSKRYLTVRGPGRDFVITRTGSGDTLAVTGDGISLSGFQLGTAATGSGHGIKITDADFVKVEHVWILDTQGDGIHILRGSNCIVQENVFSGTGVGGSGDGIHIVGTSGVSTNNVIKENVFSETAGDSILIEQGTTNDTLILKNLIHDSVAWGINIGASSTDAIVHGNIFGNNASGNITDAGTTTVEHHNRDWLSATVEGRTLDVTATGEAALDLGNVTGVLGNANVGWIDSNDRVDVGSWLGTAVTLSATTALPEVDTKSISDNAAAADNVQANIGNLDGTVSSRMAEASISTSGGAIDVVTLVTTATTVTNDVSVNALTTAAITDVWSTDALTEAYAVDGATFTPAQGLYMVWSALSEFIITGTAISAKKLDGTTEAMVFTMDDGTNPTQRLRTS